MKKEDIKKSFDNIEINEIEMQRMLNKVLHHSDNKRKGIFMKTMYLKKAIPIFAMAIIVVGGIITYNLFTNKGADDAVKDSGERTDLASRENLDIAQLKDQFQIGNKHYIILTDEQKEEFKFSSTIKESSIGDKITTITTSVDDSLKGYDVYRYMPAGGEAIVAVKMDNEYKLFKFFAFDSYNNNQDEDVITYLKLYGINSADDIAKIQFIIYSNQAKIENRLDIKAEIIDRSKITEFYNYYSIIKNSSDKYFAKLFNFKSSSTKDIIPEAGVPKVSGQIPPDYLDRATIDVLPNKSDINEAQIAEDLPLRVPVPADVPTRDIQPGTVTGTDAGTYYDTGETDGSSGSAGGSSGSAGGSSGSAGDALNNAVTIRIYNKNGVYFDAVYYSNLNFISRHEVSDDFASFLNNYIK